jgi:hypothetical protein
VAREGAGTGFDPPPDRAALRRGIRVFTGVVLPENARMLNLLRDLDLPERLRYEDGGEYVKLELFPRT